MLNLLIVTCRTGFPPSQICATTSRRSRSHLNADVARLQRLLQRRPWRMAWTDSQRNFPCWLIWQSGWWIALLPRWGIWSTQSNQPLACVWARKFGSVPWRLGVLRLGQKRIVYSIHTHSTQPYGVNRPQTLWRRHCNWYGYLALPSILFYMNLINFIYLMISYPLITCCIIFYFRNNIAPTRLITWLHLWLWVLTVLYYRILYTILLYAYHL